MPSRILLHIISTVHVTPGDQIMEQLIRELNDPANQGVPDRINEIQKQIQQLQREQAAWQLGLEFLQHNDSLIRFYGALTLTIKINADWDNDNVGSDDGMTAYLLEALVSSYVRLSLAGDSNFVLQKLCSTLAALQQRLGTLWQLPLRHVFACLIKEHFVPQQSLPEVADIIEAAPPVSARQLSGAVRFATTLIEDLTARMAAVNEKATVYLSASCLDVFQLLSNCLTGFCRRSKDTASQSAVPNGTPSGGHETFTADLARICLQAIPPWTAQLKVQAVHALKSEVQATSQAVVECITSIFRCVEHETLTAVATQSLISVQHISPKLLVRAEPSFPQSFVGSAAVQNLIAELQAGDFSHEAVLLVEFLESIMTQVDLSSPEYILSGRYSGVLQILLGLLRCEGVPMVEDTTCQVVLETIVMIVEGYTDWDRDEGALDYLRSFVREACESSLTKIKTPQEEMEDATQTWDTDDRAKFNDFRMDVQDFLQSAFTILGATLVEAIVHTIVRERSDVSWPDFEASLFCLIAFSDTMTAEPDLYDPLIEATLTSDYFKRVLETTDVPNKARNTSIRFLTEVTGYLQRYPHLMQVLNFLFSSLHQHSLMGSASRAIYTLCDAQRSYLTPALPGFIGSLSAISDLRGIEKHRIYGGVAAIVQALPNEDSKIDPLSKILGFVSQNVSRGGADDSEGSRVESVTDVLQTMAAIGRGLRVPNDSPIDLETSTTGHTFWIDGPGSIVQHRVLDLYQYLVDTTQGTADSASVEAACDFLRSGFTEEHPSPLKFAAPTSTTLVQSHISLSSPNIDAVMGCASSLLASMERAGSESHLAQLLHVVTICGQKLLTEYQSTQSLGDSNFPSASMDFVSRMLPKWIETTLSINGGHGFLDLFVQMAVLVVSEPDTLPRRSAASFFSALVDVSKPGKSLNETAKQKLDEFMQLHSPRVLAALVRLIGGECTRSELEVLTDPLRRYVLHQPMLFKTICREAMKVESAVMTEKALLSTTPEQRSRFVSQMEGLRGGRKSNDVVKEFWIACRGTGFGYIA